MFSEDDLLPVSALQHLVFCERQWGLIHIEGLWEENLLTAQGRHLHKRVDTPETEVRADVRISRGLRLRSLRLGLSGKADVVEFHRLGDGEETSPEGAKPCGMSLDGVPGLWRPVPVEYKRGAPKQGLCDKVQLCAQALCMEEMMGVDIPGGALFYWRTRRRYDVSFDIELRRSTEALCARLHELSKTGNTPGAKYGKKCESCSLLNQCMPKAVGGHRKAKGYLLSVLRDAANGEGE